MASSKNQSVKPQRWYLGGVASAGAVFFTHPLDLLKVHLQTQQKVEKRLLKMGMTVMRKEGILGLYNGLSASILRQLMPPLMDQLRALLPHIIHVQLSYSTTRFGIYEVMKVRLTDGGAKILPFYQKILLAVLGGVCGGIVGSPADMINVRMQNDMKIKPEFRRNYKHAIDGLIRVAKEEGLLSLWRGSSLNVTRGVLITVAQVAFYEQIKQMLLTTSYFNDTIYTHFTASIAAGAVATGMTQPVDVIKTRMMNSKPGEFKNIFQCVLYTARVGPQGFFKGFFPAFTRLGPQTILTWVFLEKLRQLFPLPDSPST